MWAHMCDANPLASLRNVQEGMEVEMRTPRLNGHEQAVYKDACCVYVYVRAKGLRHCSSTQLD